MPDLLGPNFAAGLAAPLAGDKKTSVVETELHGLLTRLVDPEAVNDRAFVAQERRLTYMIRKYEARCVLRRTRGTFGRGTGPRSHPALLLP